MNKKQSSWLTAFGTIGLVLFLGLSLGVTSCIHQESKKLTPEWPYESLTSTSSSEINSSSTSSDNTNEELPIPEEKKIDTKTYNFTFTKEIDGGIVENLFERMFDEITDCHQTPEDLGYCVDDDENNFNYDLNYQIFHKTGSFNCPLCNKTNKYLVTMTRGGLIEYYIFNHCSHLPNNDEYLYINLAKSFANYLNKEDAVLVGPHYKYDFGLIKKGDIYYFEFLGLNIPVITTRLDKYYYEMLDSMKVLVEFNVNSFDDHISKPEDFETRNLIPLMFYKHFANWCIDYALTPAAENLRTKATEDLETNSYDIRFVPEDKKSDLTAYYDELLRSEKYKLSLMSGKNIVDEAFITTFKTMNPTFQNTDKYYIENNEIVIVNDGWCESPHGTISSGNIIGEYIIRDSYNLELLEIFPFYNNFAMTPGWCDPDTAHPEGYVQGEAIVDYATEIGSIATLGAYQSSNSIADLVHGMNPNTYKEFTKYNYSIGLTDAYYQELEFYIEKGLFTHCAISYVNTLLGGDDYAEV